AQRSHSTARTSQTSVLPLPQLKGAQASLPLPRVAQHPRGRGSRKAACSHCVVARVPNFESRRASVAQAMADTRFVATSKRNGAVVVMARCDESRRIAHLQSLVKDIQHSQRDYRAVDTEHRARSNSAAA